MSRAGSRPTDAATTERVRCVAVVELGQGHALALQVLDAGDRRVREQFLAADMKAGQRHDRHAGVDVLDHVGCEAGAEVREAVDDVLDVGQARLELAVADVREAFGADQVLGDRDWRAAGRVAQQPGRGGLRRPVVGERGALPISAAAPASDNVAVKSRLTLQQCSWLGLLRSRPFSSRLQLPLDLVRKRQSVPSAMIFCGLDLIMPVSCMRSA